MTTEFQKWQFSGSGKLFSLLLIGLICLSSCKEKVKSNEPIKDPTLKLTTEAPERIGLLKGTDAPIHSQIDCENSYTYNAIQICSKPHPEYNGYVLSVTDFNADISFEIGTESSCFFLGMSHELILVDTGTGQARGLEIFDIKGKLLFEGSYMNEPTIEDDSLFYWSQIDQNELEKLPACADSMKESEFTIGFIAQNKLNLKTLSNSRTGKVDCQFFE